MTMPLSPNTTYVAGSTPSVKAQDLNDVQQYTCDLYTGARSVKALLADGTGGVAATPNPGVVQGRGVAATATSTPANPGPGHISVAGPTPAIACTPVGTFLGAGTGAVASVGGCDSAGIVNVTTGTGTSGAGGNICRITFANVFPNGVRAVILTPANPAAANLAVTSQVIVATFDGTSWWISATTNAIPASTSFSWFYWVIGF